MGLDILDSASFEQARTLPEACQPCEFRESCHGGCAGRRRLQGALPQPDYYCPIIRGERPQTADSHGCCPRSAKIEQLLHHRRDCQGRRFVKDDNKSLESPAIVLAGIAHAGE